MRKSAQSASPWESNTLHCIVPNIHFFPERFFSSVITQRYIHLCSWQTTRITCLVTQGHLTGNCFMEVCHLTFMFLVRSISKKQQPFCKKRLILEITPSACAEYLVTANICNEGIMLSNTGCISLPLTRRDISKNLTERAGGDDGKNWAVYVFLLLQHIEIIFWLVCRCLVFLCRLDWGQRGGRGKGSPISTNQSESLSWSLSVFASVLPTNSSTLLSLPTEMRKQAQWEWQERVAAQAANVCTILQANQASSPR